LEVVYSIRPILAIAVSLLAAGAILGLRDRANLRDAVSLIAAVVKFLIIVSMAPIVLGGGTIEITLFEILPGVDFAFRVDSLGMVFATISSLLWIAAAVYCIGYMRALKEHAQTRFFAAFAVSLSAAVGGAFAANLFTLVIFYEVLSLVTYPLVYHRETEESWHGSRRYLVYLVGASKTFLLAGLALSYQLAGTLDFKPSGLFDGVDASPLLLSAVYFCYLAGFAKAAIMPLHAWLPAAMVAPTPVSALLHAVAVVKAGVFTVLKVAVYLFGIDVLAELAASRWLMYLAAATIIIASLVALNKDNLKARLAYSTVSQLSYIVLGAMMANALGIIGGAMHIAMHGFGKITLFFCAGAIYVATHKTEVSEMRGLGRTMPVTMGAFLVASLSLVGLPPLGGLWSKWYLALGTLDAGEYALLGVLMVSSLLNAAYLIPIPVRAFFGTASNPGPESGLKEAPWPCVVALTLTALGCLVLFVFPGPLYRLLGALVP
jgi:multicomponent Na+:H+ antiporter subunit D